MTSRMCVQSEIPSGKSTRSLRVVSVASRLRSLLTTGFGHRFGYARRGGEDSGAIDWSGRALGLCSLGDAQ